MVEVYKTNVNSLADSEVLLIELKNKFAFYRINFDLNDCDRILRAEGEVHILNEIPGLLNSMGFFCEVLEDLVFTDKSFTDINFSDKSFADPKLQLIIK
jgi:hypothetical protein